MSGEFSNGGHDHRAATLNYLLSFGLFLRKSYTKGTARTDANAIIHRKKSSSRAYGLFTPPLITRPISV